jgi:hypothetical protein
MPYLNPEIFPDDWDGLFLDEDDCCEENRRNIRQLWLRLLSANRISTQNDAQLQNSQVHYGISCQHITVRDTTGQGTDPGQPPSVTKRVYFVGGASSEEPGAHTSGANVKSPRIVQRLSLAGETIAATNYNLGGRRSWCSTGFESATTGFVLDLQSANRITAINYLDETVTFLSIANGHTWDSRAVSQDHQATIFGGFRNNATAHRAISEFLFALQARAAVATIAPHFLTYGGTGKSATKGYIAGGWAISVGAEHRKVQAYTFATKAIVALVAELSEHRMEQASVGNLDKSIWAGGIRRRGLSTGVNTMSKLTHSGEATAAVTATLATARTGAQGGSGGGFGYIAGGRQNSHSGTFFTSVERVALGDESRTTLNAGLVKAAAFGATVHAK